MKIIKTTWFSNSQGTIGIVMTETEENGIRYHIGKAIIGDEGEDAQYIADFGASFPKEAGDALFGILPSPVGFITKETEGVMPWTKLNSQATKISIGKHPIYLR